MTIEHETIDRLAREVLRRQPEAEQVADSLPRLESILSWVRGMDEARLRITGPAGLLDLTHPAWGEPAPAQPAWQTVVPTGRGSGYGAPPPQTAAAGPAPVAGGVSADRPACGVPIPDGLLGLSLMEVAGRIRPGEVSPGEVVDTALRRIEELNPELKAFITVELEELSEGPRPEFDYFLIIEEHVGYIVLGIRH